MPRYTEAILQPVGPWISTVKAAEHTGLSETVLKRMRGAGEGPNWSKVGERVVYDVHELNRWMASKSVRRRQQSQAIPASFHPSAILA